MTIFFGTFEVPNGKRKTKTSSTFTGNYSVNVYHPICFLLNKLAKPSFFDYPLSGLPSHQDFFSCLGSGIPS